MIFADKPELQLLKDFLLHDGVGHLDGGHSGRYPFGSGKNPYQHDSTSFLARIKELRADKNFEFYDDREFLKDNKGKEYPNPDYGKTFHGDAAIARSMEMSTKEFKLRYSIAYNNDKIDLYNKVLYYKDQGMGATEIGKKLGINEGSVRSLLKSGVKDRQEKTKQIAETIKQRIDEDGMIQVGSGVEKELNISRNQFDTALEMLALEGYPIYSGRVPQTTDMTGSKQSTFKVICTPGTEHKDIYDFGKVKTLNDYTSDIDEDGNVILREKKTWDFPASMDSKRLMIRYAEEGGTNKDGVIELRRGLNDLNLGEKNYAQVRILVDDSHYLKGMALYSDDLPEGIDVRFNTNKKLGTPLYKVLKDIKSDPENPFGAALREGNGQRTYIDIDGNEKLNLVNITREEGDWNAWSNKVPSQFLAKQSLDLAKKQLSLTLDLKKQEYNDILACENPTVRKQLLDSFAEDCDSEAIHLKAASLPRQSYQVILPIESMKDNEVFAPNYKDGEKVALIRYPHEGTFEIPILTVNNKQKEAVSVLGKNVKDCVGINKKVADRLSGADFDGDTVMVIPTNDKVKITSTNPLKDLEGFDTKLKYGPSSTKVDADGKEHYYNALGVEYKTMTNTQNQMGRISNLITDMTIKGAKEPELARATKHAMVVIDAEKHHLDYLQSYKDNKIGQLMKDYQEKVNDEGKVSYGGASTLLSRAKSPINDIPKRKGSPKVNLKGTKYYDPSKPEGSLIYKNDPDNTYLGIKVGKKVATVYERNGKYFYNNSTKKGEKNYVEVKDISKIKEYTRYQRPKPTKMGETDDARTLISTRNSRIEQLYADFANGMKDLANKARVTSSKTIDISYSASAAKTYDKEVKSLSEKLLKAEKNAPREKQALLISQARVKAMLDNNPDITTKEEKKIRQRELTKARAEVGAKRYTIDIEDKEWEAIQSGAISKTKLKRILDHCETDTIKERATPRGTNRLPASKISMIKTLVSRGYTAAQIAEQLDISTSTVHQYS